MFINITWSYHSRQHYPKNQKLELTNEVREKQNKREALPQRKIKHKKNWVNFNKTRYRSFRMIRGTNVKLNKTPKIIISCCLYQIRRTHPPISLFEIKIKTLHSQRANQLSSNSPGKI